jgi:hypothetical protein
LTLYFFFTEITDGTEKHKFLVFKSIPGVFVIEYLFKAFKVVDNKVRIGSKEKAIFEIDIINKVVTILDKENEGIKMFEFGTSTNLQNRILEEGFDFFENKIL